MKINTLIVLAMISLPLLPKSVAAQESEFCTTLVTIAEQAPDKFRKYRQGRDETGDYVSSVTLPGADECYIEKEDGELICYWNLAINKDASTEGKKLADGLRECFPSATYGQSTVTRIALHRYKIRGVVFRVGIDEKKNRVRLGVERDN